MTEYQKNMILDAINTASVSSEFFKAVKELVEAPPVTPKQRTGKWIKTCPMVVDGGLAKCIKCSECGDERIDYFISKRYCPNCGAKMEGET